MRDLPPPLGYKGLSIEKGKLDRIIYCLNLKDHKGMVYFPEVMWAIFYSILGKSDDKGMQGCKPMKAILRRLKNKYPGLGRSTSLDMLYGNKIDRNDITVAKYLCALIILKQMKMLVDKRTGGKMTVSRIQRIEVAKRREKNQCLALWNAITTKPEAFEQEQ